MLIRRPRIFRNGPLELQSLPGHHIMQMRAHRSTLIPLNHEINISLLALITDRGIWSYDRLFRVRTFIFRKQRAGNLKTGDIIAVGKGEAKSLRVVVDLFYSVEFEGDETLVAASEGFVGCLLWSGGAGGGARGDVFLLQGRGRSDRFRLGRFGRGARVVVISASTNT